MFSPERATRAAQRHANKEEGKDQIKSTTTPQVNRSGMGAARMTTSSFYDATLKNQRVREETQKEEMEKQMLRIFGESS